MVHFVKDAGEMFVAAVLGFLLSVGVWGRPNATKSCGAQAHLKSAQKPQATP